MDSSSSLALPQSLSSSPSPPLIFPNRPVPLGKGGKSPGPTSTARLRTTSLLSSVSVNMPRLTARLSFSGWNGKEGPRNDVVAGSGKKGKGKDKERFDEGGASSKAAPSRAALLKRHFSSSKPPPIVPMRCPPLPAKIVPPTMSRYTGRFAVSSPDLRSTVYQAWPSAVEEKAAADEVMRDEGGGIGYSRVQISPMARYAHRAAKSFSSLVPRHLQTATPVASPGYGHGSEPSDCGSGFEEISLPSHPSSPRSFYRRTTIDPPSPSPVVSTHRRSLSPVATDSLRLAARAEALDKLTASPTSSPSSPIRFPTNRSIPPPRPDLVGYSSTPTDVDGPIVEEVWAPPTPTKSLPRLTRAVSQPSTPSLPPARPRKASKRRISASLEAQRLLETQISPLALGSPQPLPIEIDLKGRAIRAKSYGGLSRSSQEHERERSGSAERYLSSSPDSSRFTDLAMSSARTSLDVPHAGSNLKSVVERTKEREVEGVVGRKNKVYGDRRMAESAIDLMSVVEEDDGTQGRRDAKALARRSQPVFPSRDYRSPPTSPSPLPVRSRRYESEAVAPLGMETSGLFPQVARVRKRHSSDVARSIPVGLKRSPSQSAVDPSILQRAELPVPVFLQIRSNSQPAPTSLPPSTSPVPFPATSPPSIRPELSPIQIPRQHKRWNSEVHIERVTRDDVGFGVRSRHESFNPSSPLGGRPDLERSASRVERTKLVLREDGRPTLTYQLGECIGRGQFGSVYRALNLNSGRVVAVKRIQLEGKSEEEIQQLSNEVSMLKSLAHPGVVKYEGLVRTEHYVNIILEYVENGSLQKTLKHFGDLPEGLVASYVVKILEGLDYLHSKQVVHCDLKAANILSTKNGNIKLSDFGVSLNLNAVLRKDVEEINGTPNWMAPEVIQLQGASTASDIWSLACTIIELITGKPPYAELLAMSAMFRIVEDDRPPIPPRCSPELSDFLIQCFAKDPLNRPTADELFNHKWLQLNWDPRKDLRPQDSIPFLRRISSEMRRPEVDVYGCPVADRVSPSPADLAFYSSSPLSMRTPLFPSPGIPHRGSFESGELLARNRETATPEPIASSSRLSTGLDEGIRSHAFVKTTFSKAVDCRLCYENTKRNAVLCKSCGLICHARCIEFAPPICDLRSQLLNYSRGYVPRASSPLSTPSSSFTKPPGFNLAIILPFSKSRKLRSSTPPSSGPLFSPNRETPSLVSPTTPPRVPSGRLNFGDLVRARTRSPDIDITPPSSIYGGDHGARYTPKSISSTQSGRRVGSNDSTMTTPILHSPSSNPKRSTLSVVLPPLPPHAGQTLSTKRSTVQTASGTKLTRRISHHRSKSEASPKKGDAADCLLM